jgi:hypothetical protein
LAAPVWLAVLNADYRGRFLIILRARWLANLLTILPIAAIGLGLYLYQGRTFAAPLAYLAPFYFDPAGQESRMAFLLRNLHNMFNLFSPVSAGDAAKFGPALTALFGFTGMAVYFARIRAASRDILTSLTTAVFLLMLAAFMAAGLRGRYPFGGGLRHQFLLFPFVALSSVTLLDRLAALIRVPHARTAVLALGFVAAGANAKARFDSFQNIRSDHATRDVAVFRNLFPNPDAVLLDQFSVVNFFTHYYDWKWRTTAKYGSLYTYAVSRNGDEFTVLRDQSLWNFDFGEAHLYWSVQQALARTPGHSITVFCIDQFGSHVPRTPDQEQVFRTKARTLAAQAGLELTRLFVDGQDVYANFVYAHGYHQMADLDLNGPTVLLAQPQETMVIVRTVPGSSFVFLHSDEELARSSVPHVRESDYRKNFKLPYFAGLPSFMRELRPGQFLSAEMTWLPRCCIDGWRFYVGQKTMISEGKKWSYWCVEDRGDHYVVRQKASVK